MLCPKCGKMNKDASHFCVKCGTPLTSFSDRGSGSRLKGKLAGKSSGGTDGTSRVHNNISFNNGTGNKSQGTADSWGSSGEQYGGKKAVNDVRYCKKCSREITTGQYCSSCSAAGGGNSKSGGTNLWIAIVVGLAGILAITGALASSNHSNEKTTMPRVTPGVSAPPVTFTAPPVTFTIDSVPQITPYVMPVHTPTPTPEPVPTAAPKSGPGPGDIQGHDSGLIEPNTSAWLSEYDIRFVQSTGGVSIYLRWGPSTDYAYFDTVKEAEPVTVLAEENGFSLVLASGNRLGWCKSALIVSESEQVAPVPSLNETYWTYQHGQTMGATEACLFHSDGTYSAYSYGGFTYSEGTYKLSGRRLTLDNVRYIWNGSEFVSTEKFEMQIGWDYRTVSPDPEAYYEELKNGTGG